MKLTLIKIKKSTDKYWYPVGSFLFLREYDTLNKDIEESEIVEEFIISENMSFSGRAESLRHLIQKQEISLEQCKTQIRRLPIRENILRKLLILNKSNEEN